MRVAEFFAGIGLVRRALEANGLSVVWANDIDRDKLSLYQANFDATDFHLADIRDVSGCDIPDVALATASFPCTDLSLAGRRLGLRGAQSGLFWEFARVIRHMRGRRPAAIMLENVPSLATSRGGRDLYSVLRRLNRLGYWCDLLVVDARHFVPQSRPRLFIIGSRVPLAQAGCWRPSALRPAWIERFVERHPDLCMQALPVALPVATQQTLSAVVEQLADDDPRWWDAQRSARFVSELSALQHARLMRLQQSADAAWATAYRRTRNGKPAWEIRPDAISGCLRTARGGSSKQAVLQAGRGVSQFRIRWMTAVEYARLQGADGYAIDGVSENTAVFGFGDAVCVPVVSWLARAYLVPLLSGHLETRVACRYPGASQDTHPIRGDTAHCV